MEITQVFDVTKSQELAVTTLFGLEELLVEELKKIGANNIEQGNRVVHCSGELKTVYKSCLNLRFALRVLLFVDEFEARTPKELYSKSVKLPWENILNDSNTFSINFVVNSKYFKHSKFASFMLKDAIVDRIRDKMGNRPSVRKKYADYQFMLHISDEFVSIYLDASGEPLNQRGYRHEAVSAPLNEILAAALVKFSGWDGTTDFMDGMCGSATIPIEAVYQARNIPSQWYRTRFGFMTWKNYDYDLWKDVREQAMSNVCSFSSKVYANDLSKVAIKASKQNIANARLDNYIQLTMSNFKDLYKTSIKGTIVMNPPYGERLNSTDMCELYQSMGDTLKQHFDGWDAWIITSNKKALKHLGLRSAKRIRLFNGPIETRLVHYPLYRGSKKRK